VKWFEKAVGREKIIHLFDGDLELKNVFLDTVLCYDYKLDLVFYLFDLPTNFPEKWQKSAFNAIKINLEFFNLDEIHFYSKEIHQVNGQLELLLRQKMEIFSFRILDTRHKQLNKLVKWDLNLWKFQEVH